MTLHKITEFYTEWFSICLNTTSQFCTMTILKSFVKQIMIQIKLVGSMLMLF
jgi:hypothetical protein